MSCCIAKKHWLPTCTRARAHTHACAYTYTHTCADEHNQECARFRKVRDVVDEPAFKAAVAACVYGTNAVDADNGYRCKLEVLQVTLQQLAFCAHTLLLPQKAIRKGGW
eukprot:1139639-Pelagomonas_calceolata.AAC.1